MEKLDRCGDSLIIQITSLGYRLAVPWVWKPLELCPVAVVVQYLAHVQSLWGVTWEKVSLLKLYFLGGYSQSLCEHCEAPEVCDPRDSGPLDDRTVTAVWLQPSQIPAAQHQGNSCGLHETICSLSVAHICRRADWSHTSSVSKIS